MILDRQLIGKTYYETFLKDGEDIHPVQSLGEEYYRELGNEETELAYIRFAQGEVYYHNKDFESAIFKWEQVQNDLQDWANKNIADALFDLGKLSSAEEKYKSITSDSKSLTVEVLLQLFSLYMLQENDSKADEVIKQAVTIAPDYPNVTPLAKSFYETKEDWQSAVALAVHEMVRTESVEWADVLKRYTDDDHLSSIEPSYFSNALFTLFKVDDERYKKLIVSLWKNYRVKDSYLSWLETVNQIFLQIEVHPYESWHGVVNQFRDTYRELLSGTRYIRTFQPIMPNHLQNWLKLSDVSEALFAAAALLAWEQAVPNSMNDTVITDAQQLMYESNKYEHSLEDSVNLFNEVLSWAEQNGVFVSFKWKWHIQQLLDFNLQYVLLTGTQLSGKENVKDIVLGKIIGEQSSANVMYFRNDARTFAHLITDDGEEEYSSGTYEEKNLYIDSHFPSRFLNENKIVLIDMPSINDGEINPLNHALFADTMLFVLHAHLPFTDLERDFIMHTQEQAPHVHIQFLLNKAELLHDANALHEVKERIHMYFPDANVIPFSSQEDIKDITSCLVLDESKRDRVKERIGQLQRVIRNLLTYLLEKRVEAENLLVESINWNENMVVKLNGLINNVSSLEQEKNTVILQSYKSIKEKIAADLTEQIPAILKQCSKQVSINSDFRIIDKQLNDSMNEQIQNYVNDSVMPKFVNYMLDWINNCKEELTTSQQYLDETKETFNSLYEENRMMLCCDFKVLDDWKRDVDRIMRRVHIDHLNILLKFDPTLFTLKSIGNLFGRIDRSKSMLSNQYKKYVEQKDYTEIKDVVIRKFFAEFELFERALEQDVALFFREPIGELKRMVEETHIGIQQSRDELNEMKAKPEIYQDPITLFEVQLRQQEMMWNVGNFPIFIDNSKV